MCAQFELAFWHPFGPHGGEQPDAIIARKRREIDANDGWTLWSFQPRRMLADWMHEIRRVKPASVMVYCSRSRGAVDPPNVPVPCRSYRFVEDSAWRALPASVSIPHPFRRPTRRVKAQSTASAFVVQQVIDVPLGEQIDTPVEWVHRSGVWRCEKIPTRGEYLIRPGSGVALRPYRAVLVLREPYLAVVRATEEVAA